MLGVQAQRGERTRERERGGEREKKEEREEERETEHHMVLPEATRRPHYLCLSTDMFGEKQLKTYVRRDSAKGPLVSFGKVERGREREKELGKRGERREEWRDAAF